MNSISKLLAICCIAVLLAGCEEPTPRAIIAQANARGKITDEQAEILSRVDGLRLSGLTSITDRQAEILSKVSDLCLNCLTSITDQQADSLGKVRFWLNLNGLTSINNQQAESLSKVENLEVSEKLRPLINKYKKQ